MEFQSVTPAFINKENFFPLIIQNRVVMINHAIHYAMKDIACELQIDISKFKLEYYYDTGNELEGGEIHMLTVNNDNNNIYVCVFVNVLIDCYNKYTLYYVIHEVIKSMAHEMRHIYQFINNVYEIKEMNQEYVDNYEDIDYEKDAIEFSELYVDNKTMFIISIYIQCMNDLIRSDIDYFSFDIYHFINNFINTRNNEFVKICGVMNFQYVTEFNSILILPSYIEYDSDDSCKIKLDDNKNLIVSDNIHERLTNVTCIDELVFRITDEICSIIIDINKRFNGDTNTSYVSPQFDLIRNSLMTEVVRYCIRTIY